ncbi:hypothetical protein FF011L_31960 [Roseimaritima multifibrata]|uniref:Uncharacterized protein n=1 Tax=Roseimaritima multifibrata TaxID=1930274 RepID=A0A517MHZ5_9BACT|nr:hypothetical protein [Roseimaritima multifibrata]QDS94417.1 hypothetical protein FF011L_31960 [Roseimaritima multifibrata]
MNREQFREYLLAGTVTFPGTFPRIASLQLKKMSAPSVSNPAQAEVFLSATERPSPRVSLTRSVNVKDVRAVFLPRDPSHLAWNDGRWLLSEEVLVGIELELANQPVLWGIAFVPETAPAQLEMSAGMTAGECIQYYPPMPRDPANDHYSTAAPVQGVGIESQAAVEISHSYQHAVRQQAMMVPCESFDFLTELSPRSFQQAQSQAVEDPFLGSSTSAFPCE